MSCGKPQKRREEKEKGEEEKKLGPGNLDRRVLRETDSRKTTFLWYFIYP